MGDRLRLPVIVVMVLLLGGVFYAFAYRASRGGASMPLFSIRRYDPWGAAALYELLRDRGLTVRPHERPFAPTGNGVLIQILPISVDDQVAPWESARTVAPDRLTDWIAQGNTVIQFTAAHTALMRVAGIESSTLGASGGSVTANLQSEWREAERLMRSGRPPEQWDAPPVTVSWLPSAAKATGAPAGGLNGAMVMRSPRMLDATATDTWTPLQTSVGGDDFTHAGVRRIGAGRLIVIASPTPALNAFISEGDNVHAIVALLGDGPVWFDEYSHGIGGRGSIMGLIRALGLWPVLLQAALALSLYAWSTRGRRTIPPISSEPHRGAADQIVSLGRLYQRTMRPSETLQRARQEVRRRLGRALRCGDAQLDHRIARVGDPTLRQSLEQLLREAGDPVGQLDTTQCRACGYNLTGNTSGRCGECGTPLTAAQVRALGERPPSAGDGAALSQRSTPVDRDQAIRAAADWLARTDRLAAALAARRDDARPGDGARVARA